MATYYVRPDGNNSNTGTGSSAGQAWQTVVYALGSTSAGGSGLVAGDILYIAPGVYRGAITLGMASAASTISIIGDPLCTQFAGINAGEIVLTVATTDSVLSSSTLISATSKNFISWQGILFDSGSATIGTNISGCVNWTFTKCTFSNTIIQGYTANNIQAAYGAGVVSNLTIDRCSFFGGGCVTLLNTNHTSSTNVNVVLKDVYCLGPLMRQAGSNASASTNAVGISIYNCTVITALGGVLSYSTVAGAVTVRNCVFMGASCLESAGLNGNISQDYNRFYSASSLAGVPSGANSVVGYHALETLNRPLSGLPFSYLGAAALDGPNYNTGTPSGAPTFDLFTTNWAGINPDRGAIRWTGVNGVSPYIPTQSNTFTITIAPGSTSQSIELYLGATGLTASTSGLSARYNRTRTASVSIPLVARTIAQAWTAGGFAEVDATNMPGVYRLDIPDAALAAGADDVTIVVRGASGTNGAVMTVKLSSGGLTSAQTASAVWDAATASYTNNGSFGLNVLRADQQNKAGNVTLHSSGNVNRVDADVHAIANDADAATELKGALLHNGTDYISAELLSPVSAATSVHIGPYQLLADGLGADQPLDVNVGTATSIDVQVTDANGTGIDITGATVSAKVYNSGGTLVATYAGTATYADNGRLTFGLTTTVTATSGTYTVTVTRTTGATDTQIFGPLRLYVRPV